MRGTVCAVAALALLSGCGLLERYDEGNAIVAAVRTHVQEVAPPEGGEDPNALLRRFYEARKFHPAWTDDRAQRRQAGDMVDLLLRAGTHGLDPADYQGAEMKERLERPGALDSVEDRAALEVDLSRVLLRFADHLGNGRVDPTPRQVRKQPRHLPIDAVAVLQAAAGSEEPARILEGAAPSRPDYASLRHALARLHGIAAGGGWGRVADGPTLAPGASGPRVVALRHRLAASGDIPMEQASIPTFDGSLAEAVRKFQDRQGLEASGTVDAPTLEAINVPVEARIETVQLNLERWRWMPREEPPRQLLVNIPSFELRLVEGGEPVLGMRVVVGKAWSPTPVFSDEMTHVVLNPLWNVPDSITRDEIVPAVRGDSGYLERNRMRVFDGEQEVDPASVDWGSVDEEDLKGLRVRQDAGPGNALGRIKFMLPNEFDVYLHDTPAGHLFGQAERDFSHGCIRVERPLDLAARLLADTGAWPAGRIEETISSGETTEVKLARPIPVHITYLTAWATEGGEPSFGPDLYGLDRELAALLQKRRPDSTVAEGLLRSEHDRSHLNASTGGSIPWLP